jgi:hypothetical protein
MILREKLRARGSDPATPARNKNCTECSHF